MKEKAAQVKEKKKGDKEGATDMDVGGAVPRETSPGEEGEGLGQEEGGVGKGAASGTTHLWRWRCRCSCSYLGGGGG